MVTDHIGLYLIPHHPAAETLRAIGRGSAPIFLFLTGYAAHHKIPKSLVILAILTQVLLGCTRESWLPLNILFTILLGRGLIQLAFHTPKVARLIPSPWTLLPLGVALLPSEALFEYGTIGLLLVLAGATQNSKTAHVNTRVWLPPSCFLLYCLYQCPSPSEGLTLLATLSAGLSFALLQVIDRPPPHIPAASAKGLKVLSKHSGLFYLAHLALLLGIKHTFPNL